MPAVDHSNMKLGKNLPVFDPRIPTVVRLMCGVAMPPVPEEETRWQAVKTWIMGDNDQIGDCTGVGAANFILNDSTAAGNQIVLTTQQIVDFYSQCSGYDPNAEPVNGENPTDSGAVESAVLARWASTGIADSNGADKLLGYATVDAGNILACKQSMFLFGGLYIGLALPLAAQTLDVWAIPVGQAATGVWARGSWGGHCVPAVGYQKDGCFVSVTWQKPKIITRRFWRAYVDEAYVLFSNDWMRANGSDPDGFSRAQLATDLHAIRAEQWAAAAARATAAVKMPAPAPAKAAPVPQAQPALEQAPVAAPAAA